MPVLAIMGTKQALTVHRKSGVGPSTLACAFAAAMVLMSAFAAAQDAAPPNQDTRKNDGFLAAASRWFEEQGANVGSYFKDARSKREGIGRGAGDAAKTTVEGAKAAAGAVARLSTARAVSGHEKCQVAPNGAPDCVAAASTMCKAKGFESGKSLDMTTAEVCPPKVYMSGRSTGPECSTETFVSRAFCQ